MPENFIAKLIAEDVRVRGGRQVVTRFPPEPNGYLHIGHAKSICLNFDIARRFNGKCYLRFDDTNPGNESQTYIQAIEQDIRWLGFIWDGPVRYASNYFDTLYQYALHLIQIEKAYVCHLSADEAREYRGTLTTPGKHSPYRTRTVAENLEQFERMRSGEYPEGHCVLRAKIDMAAANINLRDPIIYRIRKVTHHQTGDKWSIYPTYDFTHGQSDAEEGVTHSLCTLEFEDHRPLYEWFLQHLPVPSQPRQYEFARLNLNYTVTSKRKLKQLVDEAYVDGWDDPRLPTLAGLRRRGYTPSSIRNFCQRIGVTRSDGEVDIAMLEHVIREELDTHAPRMMCVLRPVKLIIDNYPAEQVEELAIASHPKCESMGQRKIYMTREIYIDREDFAEVPPPQWKRLTLGGEVRLRGAYVIKCDRIIRDSEGCIIALHGHYDPDTLGKKPEGRKVKGVIHWVSATHSRKVEVRLYDRLFLDPHPDANREDGKIFLDLINPQSLQVLSDARVEDGATVAPGSGFQFEREGYFTVDPDSTEQKLVFNRTVALRDTWAKIAGNK